MKKFIILIIFSLGSSLYGGSDLFPFGMNHNVFYSFTEDNEYKEKYRASMDLAAAAGIKWWRPMWAFTWYSVQPNDPGYWDFETEDSLVKWAGERGLHLLPSIGYTAGWARHQDTYPLTWLNKYRYPPNPQHWDEYQDYVKAIVERYDGDGKGDTIRGQYIEEPEWLKIPIKYWECMNEPYGEYFLGTPEQYVGMFEYTRVALKSADPDAKIIGPCMTTRDESFKWEYFDTNSHSIKDSNFGYTSWQDATRSIIIYSIGLDNIDVVSHHLYCNTENFMNWIDDLRVTVGENKPIWITETGFKRTDRYEGERGTNENCGPTPCDTFSPDSDGVFSGYVLASWNEKASCDTKIREFLNIGDTVVLYNRKYGSAANDTVIYNGGDLIYKDTVTALAVGDTLRIRDVWDEDKWHTEFRQDSLYSDFLDGVIKTWDFLKDLKIFFYDAGNSMNKHAYPPRIEFGSGDTTYKVTRYHRQYLPSVYSVIDTDNNPYDAYYSIRDSILEPSNQTLPNTTINTNETRTYQAKNSITTNDFTINNGGTVAMEAGDIIHLQDGFRVEAGGYFYGATNPRYGGGGGLSSIKGISIPKEAKTSDESISKKENIPKVFSCNQNFPNPFASSTTIKYGLPKDVDVKLEIFNLAGQKVRTLVDDRQTAGYKQIKWNGTNGSGVKLPQGVYFYVLKAGNEFKDKYKMIVLK